MQIFYMVSEVNKAPISVNTDYSLEIKRFGSLSKSDILKSCWLSIQPGLSKEDTVHILSAEVSDETLDWMISETSANTKVHKVPSIDNYFSHPFAHYNDVRSNHFIPQYEYFASELAQLNDSEVIYLMNDDYLHIPNAISQIKQLYLEGYSGFFIPQDNPDAYSGQFSETRLALSNFGYMRTIKSSTPNMVADARIWKRFIPELLKAGVFADDGWTWRAYALFPAYSPMPGWATHLQEGCIAPFVDWESLAKHYLESQK